MKRPLSAEVASAFGVLENELPSKQSNPKRTNELVATAKKIERLQARRRALRKELKRIERDIKHEKKFLKALAGVLS